MIKTGIYRIEDIKTSNQTFVLKRLKNISITLYDEITDYPNADDLAERILLLFSDERGAYKRTYSKRFEDFDPIAIDFIKKHFQQDQDISFQDVGISDGRTALDFFDKIKIFYPNLNYTASDYDPIVYIIEKYRCKMTINRHGKLLEFVFPPFVFNAIKRDRYLLYPLNHIIRKILEVTIVKPAIQSYLNGALKAKELILCAPKVISRSKEDKRFILTRHNILDPFQGQNHIIRAMNILNPTYFTEDEFNRVLSHIHNGLHNGGLLITGSNQDAGSIVHGGIYQKKGNGFQKIYQSGEGSHVDQLILNVKN